MLKSIDITYGFNGEASSATVVESGSNIGIQADSIGSLIPSSLLSDYVAIRETTNNDAGFITKSKEYVDREAQRLEAIAVLVRGITAAPYGDWQKFNGRMYNFAETSYINIGTRGKTSPEKSGNILILGRTISVVTASDGNNQYVKSFSNGVEVSKSPKETFPEEIENKFSNLEISSSLKYGYTLEDLKSGAELYGYSLINYPKDNNFNLIETGGTLKDCLSAVASTYGLYWICRGNKITFFSRDQIIAYSNSIPDLTGSSNPNIISTSYTKDFLGKSKVGVIRCSASDTDTPHSNGGGSGGSSGGVPNRYISFKVLPTKFVVGEQDGGIDTANLGLVQSLYTFFMFDGTDEVFNLIFFLMLFLNPVVRDETGAKFRQSDLVVSYLDENPLQTAGFKSFDSFSVEEQNTIREHSNDTKFYSLALPNNKKAELPSSDGTYGIIKAACESVGNVFISTPVSKYRSEKYSVTATDGYQVSKAYLGTEKIKDIPELSSYYSVMQRLIKEENLKNTKPEQVTIYKLAQLCHLQGDEEFTTPSSSAYIYIAKKNFSEAGKSFEAAQKAASEFIKIKKPISSVPLEILNKKMLGSTPEREADLATMVSTSKALFTEIEAALTKADLRFASTKLADPEKETSVEGISNYSDEEKADLIGTTELKSIGVNVYDAGDLATVDIVTIDCEINEAEFLTKNFDLISPISTPLKSSSTSYFGLEPADDSNPTLASYSLTISDSSVTTSIQYSSKEILGIDQSIVIASYMSNGSKNMARQLRARQKNFLGIN